MGIMGRAVKFKKKVISTLAKDRLDIGVFCLLFLLGIVTRTPLVERYNSHWDGAQFSMAVVSYDISQDMPSPPGYPIYIFLGKIVHFLISDPHTSLLVVNVMVSALGIGLFYYVGLKMFNRSVGFLASIFFFSGAVFYYFGITTYGYGLVPVFSTLFAYSIYRIVVLKKREWLVAGLLFAINFGVRPQEVISIAPLLILASLHMSRKSALKLYIVSILGTLIWLISVVLDAGGLVNFVNINLSAIKSGGFENTTDVRELVRRIEQGIYLTVGVGALSVLYYPFVFVRKKNSLTKVSRKAIVFFCFWFFPSFLFNVLVRSDHAGHQQVYLSAFVFICSYALWKLTSNKKILLYLLIIFMLAINLWNFFRNRDPQNIATYTQTSFHYTDLVKNNTTYSEKIAYIKANFRDNNTVLFATSPMWRVTSYYLPDYQLYNIVSLETISEHFRYIVRTERYWKSTERTNTNFIFKVPDGNNYIVFFDTEYCSYNISGLKKIQLPKNNCIGVLPVKPGATYKYNYKIFRVMK